MIAVLRAIGRTLGAVIYGWLVALVALIRSIITLCRSRRGMTNDEEHERKRARTRCVPIDDPAYVRPDPFIYDQYYLRALGLNVTWDNPDFAILKSGVTVPAHSLEPDTEYDVVVRVWNGSLDCPVVKMPVHLSYLSFGVGTVSHLVATEETDVGVRGAPNNPALLHFAWRTPPDPGHYCLQAQLDPVADVNPGNNLGQHNTNVVATQSPATFTFALRNGPLFRRQFGFWTDAYVLGPIRPCQDDPADKQRRDEYNQVNHPLPAGWAVAVTPSAPVLNPGEEIPIQVTVTPPPGWTGNQTVNVHSYFLDDGGSQQLAGGVTVVVTAS